jgi:UDP-N-acetyl-D-glucosamine dehydrogenase
LNERGRAVKDANILVLGVAYKEDVGDARESPAIRVLNALQRRGAHVAFHDPFIRAISTDGLSLERTDLTGRSVARADCVALLTPHRTYDFDWIAETASLVFDARNAYESDRYPNVVRL